MLEMMREEFGCEKGHVAQEEMDKALILLLVCACSCTMLHGPSHGLNLSPRDILMVLQRADARDAMAPFCSK